MKRDRVIPTQIFFLLVITTLDHVTAESIDIGAFYFGQWHVDPVSYSFSPIENSPQKFHPNKLCLP